MTTTIETEAVIDKWETTIDGLNRAVEWIRRVRPELRWGFTIVSTARNEIEIDLGCVWSDSPLRELLREWFAGQQAERTIRDNLDERFVLTDAESGLRFSWTVWSREKKKIEDKTVVTI